MVTSRVVASIHSFWLLAIQKIPIVSHANPPHHNENRPSANQPLQTQPSSSSSSFLLLPKISISSKLVAVRSPSLTLAPFSKPISVLSSLLLLCVRACMKTRSPSPYTFTPPQPFPSYTTDSLHPLPPRKRPYPLLFPLQHRIHSPTHINATHSKSFKVVFLLLQKPPFYRSPTFRFP